MQYTIQPVFNTLISALRLVKAALLLGLCSLILLYVVPIHAAEQQLARMDDLLDLSLDELFSIPITSTSYFDETPLDVASTVTVIPRQDWEKRGARRFSDALQAMPGVISIPNFLGQDSLRIRGYALADARGVATLWDGVSINSFNLGTADVERPNVQLDTLGSVEVIRGPGSAIYGSDAFFGVVSLNSFASNKNINQLNTRLGSTGFYSAGYNGSTTVGDDSRVTVSLASSGQPDQDIPYSYTGGTADRDYKYQATTFVSKFESSITDKWSYKAGFYVDDTDSDKFHSEGSGAPAGKDTGNVNTDLSMFKLDIKYQLSSVSDLNLQSYYWESNRLFERPVTTTRDININGEEHREAVKLVYRNNNIAGNTELTAALGTRKDKIDVQHRKIFDATTTYVDADLPFVGISRTIDSFFIDGKTTVSDRDWIFRYSFRFDDYSDFGSRFTPRLGVIYKLDKVSVVKLLYGSAFRAPTAVEVGGTPFINGNPNIKPEELDTYELVYARQSKAAKYEAVLFHTKLTNGIVSKSGTFTNIDESKSQGLELSYTGQLEKWLLVSSASYVQSRNVTDNTDYIAFPTYIFNLGTGYNFSASWSVYVNNRVHLDANEGTNNATSGELKDYWRTDLSISKTLGDNLKVFANIRNLFDRDNYLPSLVDQEYGIPEDGISLDAGIQYNL